MSARRRGGGESLAVIPARGGSKRLPGKNLARLGGFPLVAFTVVAALRADLGRVIISTDSEAIARVGRRWGAETPFARPAALAGDETSTREVIVHALRHLAETEAYRPEIVMVLPATSPFRTSAQIRAGQALLLGGGFASVVGVERVGQHHPYRMCAERADGSLEDLVPVEGKSSRTQTHPALYCRNASLYVNRASVFAPTGREDDLCFDPASVRGLVMDRVSSLDITDAEDLRIAEALLAARLARPDLRRGARRERRRRGGP